MMKFYCDKCEKEISIDEIYIVDVSKFGREEIESEIQLCKECVEKIKKVDTSLYPVKQVNRRDLSDETSDLLAYESEFIELLGKVKFDNVSIEEKEQFMLIGINIYQNILNIFDKVGLSKNIPDMIKKHKENMKSKNWDFKDFYDKW